MSIISEALKKAQATQEQGQEQGNLAKLRKDPRNSSFPLWGGMILLTLAVLTWFAIVKLEKNPKYRQETPAPHEVRSEDRTPVVVKKIPSVEVPAESALRANEISSARRDEAIAHRIERALQLKGIAFIEGKGIAIINNNVLEEGDKVRGARLTKVTPEMVVLDYKGREIKLVLK